MILNDTEIFHIDPKTCPLSDILKTLDNSKHSINPYNCFKLKTKPVRWYDNLYAVLYCKFLDLRKRVKI